MSLLIVACTVSASLVSMSAYASSSSTVTIRVEQVGGFVGPNFKSARLPVVVAFGDGTVLAQRSASGSVKEMFQGKVKASVLKTQINAFIKAVKKPSGGWGLPAVADVPNTEVTVMLAGRKYVASVYALEFTSKTLPSNATAARTNLSKTISGLVKLAGSTAVYKPLKYEVWPIWVGVKPTGVGMANPAAVFCLSQNGTLIAAAKLPTPPTPLPDSSVVYCHLSDGSYVEEWSYFYKASKAGIVWPGTVAPPNASCSVVTAKPFLSLLRTARDKQWLLPSGAMTSITWRPILPGEIGCKR